MLSGKLLFGLSLLSSSSLTACLRVGETMVHPCMQMPLQCQHLPRGWLSISTSSFTSESSYVNWPAGPPMPHLTLKPRISQQQRGLLQCQDAHLRRAGQRVLPSALHLFCLLHSTVASCPPTILDKALTLGLYVSPSTIQQ